MKKSDFYAMVIELRTLLSMIGKSSREDIERRLTALDVGVSGMQFWLMHLLKRHQMTITELSRKLMLDPSTVVPMIDALERKGFVMRGKDPSDRRRIPLSLTQAGSDLVASIPPIDETDALLQAMEHMGQEESTRLLELSRELVRYLPEGETLLTEVAERVDFFKTDHLRDTLHQKPGDPS
ncbi:MAG: MarR family transcriptional regulator [Anaerolineae bacterium]